MSILYYTVDNNIFNPILTAYTIDKTFNPILTAYTIDIVDI